MEGVEAVSGFLASFGVEAACEVEFEADAALPEGFCGVEEADVVFAAFDGADAEDEGSGVLGRGSVEEIELSGVREDAVFAEGDDADGGAWVDGVLLPVEAEVFCGGFGDAGDAVKARELADVVREAADGLSGGVLRELERYEVVTDGYGGAVGVEAGEGAVVFFPEDFGEEEGVEGVRFSEGVGEGAAFEEVRELAEGVSDFAADGVGVAGALAFEVAGFLWGDRAPGVEKGIEDDGFADVAAA